MPQKLKAASFKNNQLKKTGTSVVWLDPADDGDDIPVGFCVKVVDKCDTTNQNYWGGKVQSVGGDRRGMARLKYQKDHCENVPEEKDQDDAKGSPPRGTKDETTDVSVTITNPSTPSDKSTVDRTGVKVLP